jgi:hypothetical protein
MNNTSNSTYAAATPSISCTAVHIPSPSSISPKAKFALAIALPIAAILVIVMAAVHIIPRCYRKRSVAKVAGAVQDVEDLGASASLKTPIGLHRLASRELLRTKSAPPMRPQEARLAREADGGDHSSMTGETGACREVGGEELRRLQTYDAVGKRTIYWG